MAREFDRSWSQPESSFADAARSHAYHPGYPVAFATVNRLIGGWLSDDPDAAWDLAGQWTSLAAGVLGTLAVWCLGGMLFGWRGAWVGALLFGVSRKWSCLGADVLSDALAVCLGLWAIVLAVVVIRQLRRGAGWSILLAAACGLLGGAGYLVRPEVAVVVAIAALSWLVQPIRGRAPWGITLGAILAAVLTTFNIALPYVLTIGSLTGKKPFMLLVPGVLLVAGVVLVAAIGRRKGRRAAALATVALVGLVVIGAAVFAALIGWDSLAWLPGGLLELLGESVAAMHAIVTAAALVGLIALALRPLWPALAADPMIPSLRSGATMLFVCLQACLWGILLALYRQEGYISDRHLMLSAAMFVPLAGVGLSAAAALVVRIGKDLRLPTWPRATVAVMVAIAAVFAIGHTLRPLHEKHGPYRQAAEFLAPRVGSDELVLTNSPYIAHYGRLRQRRIPADDSGRFDTDRLARMLAHNRSLRYLALARRDQPMLEPLIASGHAEEAAVFPLRSDETSKSDVFVYALSGGRQP